MSIVDELMDNLRENKALYEEGIALWSEVDGDDAYIDYKYLMELIEEGGDNHNEPPSTEALEKTIVRAKHIVKCTKDGFDCNCSEEEILAS